MAMITLNYSLGFASNGVPKTAVTVEIDDDGTVRETNRVDIKVVQDQATGQWRRTSYANHYLGFSAAPTEPPTEAQRAKLATVWLRDAAAREVIPTSPNHEVCTWAFAGLPPDEVSRRYGTGAIIYRA